MAHIVSSVRAPKKELQSEADLPLGTIIIVLENGKRLRFGQQFNDLPTIYEDKRRSVVGEAIHLLEVGRRGQNWASGPAYGATAQQLRKQAERLGLTMPIP